MVSQVEIQDDNKKKKEENRSEKVGIIWKKMIQIKGRKKRKRWKKDEKEEALLRGDRAQGSPCSASTKESIEPSMTEEDYAS